MTPQERLAALKNLESGLQTEIIRATASPEQGFYCVKLDKNADLDLVEEFRIYAGLKWEVGYFFTLPSMDHYIGLNYVSQEAATNLRTGFLEWVQAEIAKMEQPAPAKTSSALPYKVLLNSMESKMGYDSDLRLEYLLISTDENDSKMLKQDISGELVASTDGRLALIDESLYMYFKTGDHDVAKEMKAKVVEWLKKWIAETEQPPFDPREVIEAAAADQEGMDAAESEVDREQMRAEVMIPVGAWKEAVRHLYKALSAGYAKDDEIAALKKENEALLEQRLEALKYAEALERGLGHCNELLNQQKAAEPKDVQPAPVRLPVAGDTIEILGSLTDEYWIEAVMGSVGVAGWVKPSLDGHGIYWRWPEPRTRTAADAKVGEIVLFWDTMQTRDHGPVIGLGDSSVFVQASDGKVHRLPHHEFGPTGWRFEKEQSK